MRHLKAFHIFHVAASSSSYSEAAEKLCITHGAVSKQIKVLEAYLHQALFYRQGRNVRLTPAGEQLKNYTTQAFQALESGVARLSHTKQNCLEVSCEPTLTMRWLMPRLADFHDHHPETDVRLSTAGGPVKLGNTGLSLAIRRDDFVVPPDYQQTPLVEEWVGPVVSPAYWEQVRGDSSAIKLLHSQTRPQAWADWQASTGNGGFSRNTQQCFAHFYFCIQAAVDGLGAAIGSYPLVADDLARGHLIAPFGFVLSGHRYLLLRLNQAPAALEQAFIQWLGHALSDCIPAPTLRKNTLATLPEACPG